MSERLTREPAEDESNELAAAMDALANDIVLPQSLRVMDIRSYDEVVFADKPPASDIVLDDDLLDVLSDGWMA